MSEKVTSYVGYDAYQGRVNIRLFNDIIEFVASTVKNAEPVLKHLRNTHLWYLQTFNENIQQSLGFRYFGELLERYEERHGSDIADIRAIALALAFSKDMLTDDMFVGRQKDNFIRKITRLSDSDIFLKGALYWLRKDEANVHGLLSELMQMTFSKTEELVFVLSLFDDTEQTFTIFKSQLIRLLGLERTIPISGNVNIFCWLIKRFRHANWLKGMRMKDISLFRALSELPVTFVKAGNKHHDALLKNSYTVKDITFLNSLAVRYRPTGDTMDVNSIVAEKIAIDMCTIYINCVCTHTNDVY